MSPKARRVNSADGVEIYVESSGLGSTALLFVHGWMGNARWWDAQASVFSDGRQAMAMDLGSHGLSGKRERLSLQAYAGDIVAAASCSQGDSLVLVGHSMSGAYVLEASLRLERVSAIVLVDTLKDLDQLPTPEQGRELLENYRRDYEGTVKGFLAERLFTKRTPREVKSRLISEFLTHDGNFAADAVAPLYQMDVRALAQKITVPVVGINSDYSPSSLRNNRKYFEKYNVLEIEGTGHYPMMEEPDSFNHALEMTLQMFA